MCIIPFKSPALFVFPLALASNIASKRQAGQSNRTKNSEFRAGVKETRTIILLETAYSSSSRSPSVFYSLKQKLSMTNDHEALNSLNEF